MRFVRLFATLLIVHSAAPAMAANPPLNGFADLVEKLSPAVVNISTSQKVKGKSGMSMMFPELPDNPEMEPLKRFFDQFSGGMQDAPVQEREVTSLGSGFIVDPAGYIITNNHVIDGAESVTVRLSDDTKYTAKIVGRDKKTDLALLKVEPAKPLPAVTFGDSDEMRVGDWVVAIGNPFGLGGSVTQGIISARQRSINAGPFDDFLQTDAPINRGNSGGPLFNLQGEVIGINSAIFSPSGGNIGIGFAIPSALARPVIDQLKQFGRTHRGWLGVKIQEVSDEIANSVGLGKTRGALVLEITDDSPAKHSGFQPGDIITSFNGKPVEKMRFLPRLVAETKIGSTVPVTVWRQGKSVTLSVKVGELEEKEEAQADAGDGQKAAPSKTVISQKLLDMDIAVLNESLREQYGIADGAKGLLVVSVKSGSEAASRGVREGDLITQMAGEPVTSIPDAKNAVTNMKKAGRKYVLVKIEREGSSAFVALPVAESKE